MAFGAPLEADGEEQLVICCEGAGSDAPAIKEATAACVASQFGLTVHEVVVAPLASLPRTSSGKPQRRKTRQMYVDATLPRVRHDGVTSGIESDSQGERNAIQCSPQR